MSTFIDTDLHGNATRERKLEKARVSFTFLISGHKKGKKLFDEIKRVFMDKTKASTIATHLLRIPRNPKKS